MYAVASSAKVVVPTMQMKSTQSKRVAVKPVQALNVEKVRRVKFVAGEFREREGIPPFSLFLRLFSPSSYFVMD
jgi:hypothetical protein